jgi:hypothetical protein
MKHVEQNPVVPAIGALAAALATVATFGLAVLLPANATPGTDPSVLAAQRQQAAPIEVAIVPSRIDVIGVRNDKSALSEAGAPRS